MSQPREVRAPRGTELTAKSWQTEAPLRMLMNNLDPEVAERPEDLVVYGGTGRAARSWEAYDAIVRTLDELEGEGRVAFRYTGSNPNGSYRDIAGVTNERGNVVGLMPHPEHAVEDLCGPGSDGLGFFTSVLSALV